MTSPAGSGVPDERRAKWGAIYYSPVIDSKAWHYDNQGNDFLTKLIEEIDTEVAAAVSGCRRDQQAALARAWHDGGGETENWLADDEAWRASGRQGARPQPPRNPYRDENEDTP